MAKKILQLVTAFSLLALVCLGFLYLTAVSTLYIGSLIMGDSSRRQSQVFRDAFQRWTPAVFRPGAEDRRPEEGRI